MTKIHYETCIQPRLDPSKWYVITLMSDDATYTYIVNSETAHHIYIYNGTYYKVTGLFSIYTITKFSKIYNSWSDVLVDYPEIIDL